MKPKYRARAAGAACLVVLLLSSAGLRAQCGKSVSGLPGVSIALETQGNVAYVGAGQVLLALDISNPASPLVLSTLYLGGGISGIDISGTLLGATVFDGEEGLALVDISHPSDLRLLHRHPGGYARSILFSGSLAYFGYFDGLQILDVSTPEAPVVVGSLAGPLLEAIELHGSTLYAFDTRASLLIALDMSNPHSPQMAAQLPEEMASDTFRVQGGRLFEQTGDEFRIYDLTIPLAPSLLGSVATPPGMDHVWDIEVSGNSAFLGAGRSLLVIDIANPIAPSISASLATTNYAYAVGITAGHVVLSGSSGVTIVDVAAPSAPVAVAHVPSIAPADSAPLGALAVFVSYNTGLDVLDLSNAAEPIKVGHLPFGQGEARTVATFGRYAYVAGNLPVISVVDLQDPANPQLLGTIPVLGRVWDLEIAANTLIGTLGAEGFQFFSLENPERPVLTTSLPGAFSRLAADGPFVIGYNDEKPIGGTTVALIEISSDHHPTVRAESDLGESVEGLTLADDGPLGIFVYTGAQGTALRVFQLSSGDELVQVRSYPEYSRGIPLTASKNLLLVAGSSLRVLDRSDPLALTLLHEEPASLVLGKHGLLTGRSAVLTDDYRGSRIVDLTGCLEPCTSNETTMCLNNSRFAVSALGHDFEGSTFVGHTVPLSTDSGYIWFFSPDNPEIFIKVLNACSLSQNFWVFDTHLSNVDFTLEVVDSTTDHRRTVRNPPGLIPPAVLSTDTNFRCDGSGSFEGDIFTSELEPPQPAVAEFTNPGAVGLCLANDTTLCLHSGKFRVRASYADFSGNSGDGSLVSLSDASGYATFFDESNVELFFKVINACDLTSNYWVFVSGLTNVPVTFTVEDSETGATWRQTNPSGSIFATNLATSTGFVDCP